MQAPVVQVETPAWAVWVSPQPLITQALSMAVAEVGTERRQQVFSFQEPVEMAVAEMVA